MPTAETCTPYGLLFGHNVVLPSLALCRIGNNLSTDMFSRIWSRRQCTVGLHNLLRIHLHSRRGEIDGVAWDILEEIMSIAPLSIDLHGIDSCSSSSTYFGTTSTPSI